MNFTRGKGGRVDPGAPYEKILNIEPGGTMGLRSRERGRQILAWQPRSANSEEPELARFGIQPPNPGDVEFGA